MYFTYTNILHILIAFLWKTAVSANIGQYIGRNAKLSLTNWLYRWYTVNVGNTLFVFRTWKLSIYYFSDSVLIRAIPFRRGSDARRFSVWAIRRQNLRAFLCMPGEIIACMIFPLFFEIKSNRLHKNLWIMHNFFPRYFKVSKRNLVNKHKNQHRNNALCIKTMRIIAKKYHGYVIVWWKRRLDTLDNLY